MCRCEGEVTEGRAEVMAEGRGDGGAASQGGWRVSALWIRGASRVRRLQGDVIVASFSRLRLSDIKKKAECSGWGSAMRRFSVLD